jgi:mono/diheme cytochrome c family protein
LAALVVVAVAAAVVIYLACFHIPDPGLSAAVAQRQPDAAHGRYIATLGDCAACHSVSGGKALAGGVAFTTPVGVIYSTNITPDRNTGIGYYTFPDFARVMRKGVKPDGTRLYPAMPYPDYTQISDQDLQDLFAYLQTQVAAVAQPTRAVAANWPWTIRWPLGFWNLAFLNDRRFTPDASKSDQWNRGAYLVEALEHCGECHTPRRWTQSLDNGRKFAGAVQQGWKAYNITSSQQSGLGGWSDDAVAAYLMTGHADSHSSAGGPMAEAVADSLSHVSPDDVHAMVAYLRSIPAIEDEPAIAQNPPASTNGKPAGGLGEQVFAGNCANCHDWDGKGVQSPYAALAGSRAVNDPSATNLMTVLLSGSKAKLPAQHVFMPPFERGHSDDELAAVINFVSGYFGNGQAHVTAADIADARKSLPPPQQPTQAADLGERH